MNNQEIMNKPLTAEEVKNLTLPCLLEVWDGTRHAPPVYDVIVSLNQYGKVVSMIGSVWQNAALPSPEITEAIRKQFGTQSEYPKRMLVWNCSEEPEPRIILSDLGEKAIDRYIIVADGYETKWQNGEVFNWSFCSHAKPIPEPERIAQEIAQLEKRIAELKSQQQSK